MTTQEPAETTSSGTPRTAGIVSRGVAGIIDVLVVLVALSAIYLGWVFFLLAFSPRAFSFPTPSAIFSTLGFFVVATGYLGACWIVSGCTAGAVVMGTQVVGRTSTRIKPVIALLRALACVLFPIGLAWVIIDSRRRSLQDIALGTRVNYRRP